jgi:hypothetical protein
VANQFATIWKGVAAGENQASTSVMADDGGVMRCYLDEGIIVAPIIDLLVLLRGKP